MPVAAVDGVRPMEYHDLATKLLREERSFICLGQKTVPVHNARALAWREFRGDSLGKCRAGFSRRNKGDRCVYVEGLKLFESWRPVLERKALVGLGQGHGSRGV